MKDATNEMIRLALESDATVDDADRKAILAFCRYPSRADRPATTVGFSRLVPVGEAATLLSVHPRTVWRHIEAKRLRSVMVGGSRRIRMDDLTAFVERCGEALVFSGSTSTPDVGMAQAD
jgi:excisionase family DNA binding protein